MDNVVYILGAGFSAPLGLPVMKNFLIKSKDLYFREKDKYGHFAKVIDEIGRLNPVKNYYDSDLFNIEEILSILEMRASVGGVNLTKPFARFLKDVIEYYTPSIEPYGQLPNNWERFVFGRRPLDNQYGFFVSTLLNIRFIMDKQQRLCRIRKSEEIKYSVITLNYDTVLENFCTFIANEHLPDGDVCFADQSIAPSLRGSGPPLAKLHGSVNAGDIIPPTWNKGLHKEMEAVWSQAHDLLQNANHLRIVGYSLPQADAYVKYLLKSASIDSKHLKSIDVLCLDSDGSVERRFRSFIPFTFLRFVNAPIEDYFRECIVSKKQTFGPPENQDEIVWVNEYEAAHDRFFTT